MPRRLKAACPKCAAKTRKGSACTRDAGWGTMHPGVGRCSSHGGASPQAEVSGLVQLARREMQVMGMPLSIEPEQSILECIRITAGEVAYASERISELEVSEAVGPVATLKLVPASGGDEGEGSIPLPAVDEMRFAAPALHIWIVVRQQAMDRLVNFSFAALKAGIEERRVRVAEQQGMLLAQAVQGILKELGVDQRPEVAGIVRRHLTLVAGQQSVA
jgi:hypothetical protein